MSNRSSGRSQESVKIKTLADLLESALGCATYAFEKQGEEESSMKYYIRCTEILKEYSDRETNRNRKALVMSLIASFEKISRGKEKKKRPAPAEISATEVMGLSASQKGKSGERALPILDLAEKVSFQDIAGHQEAKRILHEAIIIPQRFPELFTGGKRKPWKSFLMFGPPGTGKTQLAKAIASESNAKLVSISSSDILSSLVGGSEKKIREIFQEARKIQGPCVMFLDEIDSLCRRRTENEDEHIRRVKTELLQQIEGIEAPSSRLFFLAATNCPWEIDPAFLRRFQKRVYIGLPTLEEREELFSRNLAGVPHSMKPEELKQIALEAEGFSGSDISNIVTELLMEPIRDLEKNKYFRRAGDFLQPCSSDAPGSIAVNSIMELPPGSLNQSSLRLLTSQDLLSCLKRNQKTNLLKDLALFERFLNQ